MNVTKENKRIPKEDKNKAHILTINLVKLKQGAVVIEDGKVKEAWVDYFMEG